MEERMVELNICGVGWYSSVLMVKDCSLLGEISI